MIIDGRDTGTIESVFPDGIHMVKLDNSERIVAVTAVHLTRLEVETKPGRPSHQSQSLKSE